MMLFCCVSQYSGYLREKHFLHSAREIVLSSVAVNRNKQEQD